MNILFVTGQFANRNDNGFLGGMPKAVFKSAYGMQEKGHQVMILSVGNQNKTWVYKGISVVSVRATHGLEQNNIVLMLSNIFYREWIIRKEIKRINKDWKIDIIQYAGWFGIGLLHNSKIPSIMRISSYTKVQLGDIYTENKRKCLYIIERIAVKRMDAVFAPSRVMAEGVSKDTGRKIGVMETPYEEDKIKFDNSIYNKKMYDKKYILFFGRLSKDKGIYVIRDIIYQVLKNIPEIYFVFAGSVDPKDIVKELQREAREFKERVIFLGILPPSKLYPIISNSELVVMPSLMDNFPNSCAEAMALGKIVIGTDGSSLEQFIENGYNGFLAKIGDSRSLLEQIEKAINLDSKEKERLKDNARIRITNLSPQIYFNKMEQIYTKVIKRRKYKINNLK